MQEIITLCLSTSSRILSAALTGPERFYSENYSENIHAESLFDTVETLVKKAGKSCKDINKIAIITGPGSFFGVRVGIAFARGLEFSLKIKSVGVTSHELDAFCRMREKQFTPKRTDAYVDIGRNTIIKQSFFADLQPASDMEDVTKNLIETLTPRNALDICDLFEYKEKNGLQFANLLPVYYTLPSYKKRKQENS